MTAQAVAPLGDDDVRRSIDALAVRVDTLSGIVRETAGSLSGSKADLAALDRRLHKRLGEETQRADATLAQIRGELGALRASVADGERPIKDSAGIEGTNAPVHERVERLSGAVDAIGTRVDTLSGMVRDTVGGLAAKAGEISSLRERVTASEVRLDDFEAELQSVSDLAAKTADSMSGVRASVDAAHPLAPVDPELESRLHSQATVLGERVDFLASTVAETAGRLTAREAELTGLEQRLAGRSQQALDATQQALQATDRLRHDVEKLSQRLDVDPLLQERVERLSGAVEAIGGRVDTLSGIVRENVGRLPGHENTAADLDQRLDEVGEQIGHVAGELRREIETLAQAMAKHGTNDHDQTDWQHHLTTFADRLSLLEHTVADVSSTAERLGSELRHELTTLADAAETARLNGERESAHATRLVAELAARLEEIETERGMVQELAVRADRWTSQLSEVESRVEQDSAALDRRMEELAASTMAASDRGAAHIDGAVAMLTNRLEELEHERRSVSTRVTAAENAVVEGRSTLEARLDAIAALVGDALAGDPEITRLVEDLTRRLERIENSPLTVAAPPRIPSGVEEDTLTALAELATRIDGIERDREDAAAELARTAAAWASEGASLRERVSELAAHIVTGPVPGDGGSSGGPFLQEPEELERLRIGMEGLRMRLAYHEKEVAELARSGRGGGRVEELATRVDQLSALVAASLAGGNANIGRIDSPVSAADTNDAATLWSRLARTEEAAKKDREAVLESLERIASRIDSRLQHLETVGSGDGGQG